MKNIFSKLLFKSPPKTTDSDKNQNPWVKEGDYIYLHSKGGLFQVTSVNTDGFYVKKENAGKNQQPEFHAWDDFRRWSSRSSSKQDKQA